MSTSAAGFVGPTLSGPEHGTPELLTTFADFERVYGGLEPLPGSGAPRTNYVAHAAAAFFANGGRRLYVARIGGSDDPADYVGSEEADTGLKTGLRALEDIEELAILAAPGSPPAVAGELIAHCDAMKHRFAVLDSPAGLDVGEIQTYRSGFDSRHAALYYPWVRVIDPTSGTEIDLPPSGFVAGIYARTDADQGVHHAPADALIALAVALERNINDAQQEVLNPNGINCLRFFTGRGCRVWGARTVSSDPEWRYVSVRRLFIYLEHSIERGLQWVVFEPNGESTWDRVRQAISSFLHETWRSGALLGAKPEEAFFVHCDRSTMTQNDIDNGRLICTIGVAPLRPAEFVIFRIGQKTADSDA